MRLLSIIALCVFLSPAYSQVNIKKTSSYIEKARVEWGVPGLAVGIVKDGKIVLAQGYGTLREGDDTKVDENTQFAIASNTKAFVASALANLVAEGRITWDDRIVKHLPYFELYNHYATQETTIRDLLCHRAGLGTYSGDAIWYKSVLSAEEIVKKVKYVPAAYSFRAGYGYSNLMFITAGEVIRAVTGQSWDAYTREIFLNPLKMTRTLTSISDLGSDNVATPHKPATGRNMPIDWTNWDNMGAAGGIISSVNDMSKWLMMNLNNGSWEGRDILNEEQQNVMWTPHNSFVIAEESKKSIPGRNFNGYGLGWGLYDYFGRKVVTHSGGYDGMYSRVAMLPGENLGIVILTNSMSGITLPLTLKIINDFIGEDKRDWSNEYLNKPSSGSDPIAELKKAKVSGSKPKKSLTKYTGAYEAKMHGDILIKKEGKDLKLEFSNAPDLSATLRHWHYDTWEIVWDETHAWFDFGLVKFTFDSQLEVSGLQFDVPNYDIFFDELVVIKK